MPAGKLIALIINIVITLVVSLIVFIYNKVKARLTERARTVVESIATVVEQLYDGFSPSEKLNAFRELAKKKGLNVEWAVDYLEKHIIPASKSLNVLTMNNIGANDTPDITD